MGSHAPSLDNQKRVSIEPRLQLFIQGQINTGTCLPFLMTGESSAQPLRPGPPFPRLPSLSEAACQGGASALRARSGVHRGEALGSGQACGGTENPHRSGRDG